MDSICLTLWAQVKVLTNRAHVTDTNNRASFAAVTNVVCVHFLSLVLVEEVLELLGTESLYFFLNLLGNITHALQAVSTLTSALFAGLVLFVQLLSFALEASYMLLWTFRFIVVGLIFFSHKVRSCINHYFSEWSSWGRNFVFFSDRNQVSYIRENILDDASDIFQEGSKLSKSFCIASLSFRSFHFSMIEGLWLADVRHLSVHPHRGLLTEV